jgi:heptosyltransferase-3
VSLALDTDAALKFLVVRRDNIGDLVCTTPMFEALRRRFAGARVYALTNTYNLPILHDNPFIDETFAYTKLKHREQGVSMARVCWDRARLIVELRRRRIDYAILAGTGFVPRALRFARLLNPRHIVSHEPMGEHISAIDMAVPYDSSNSAHEVENVHSILAPLGITGSPPPLCVVPSGAALKRVEAALGNRDPSSAPIAVHISARKASNRWQTERFAALLRRIHAAYPSRFLLFWSPGGSDDPRHPGDDAKAGQLINQLAGVPVVPYATNELGELIAGLSLCQRVICSDGGAMHIAAALRKPILCFFGNSGAARWRPWGVPHVLLQPASRNVSDVSVEDAFAGFQQLQRETADYRGDRATATHR